MLLIRYLGLTLFLLLLPGLLVACGDASRQGREAEATIRVEDAWARPAMAEAQADATAEPGTSGMAGTSGTTGVFLRLVNRGEAADRLVGGNTEVAKAVEIHETVMEGEVAKMQRLPNGLEVPAGGEVQLKPGSYHIMLIGLRRDLKPGDTFPLELQFEKGGTLTIQPEVRAP